MNSFVPKKPVRKEDQLPDYIMLSGLPPFLPLSVAGTLNLSYYPDLDGHSEKDEFSFVPRSVRLLAGGSFNEVLGFYLSYNLHTDGHNYYEDVSGTADNLNPDVDEAYVQLRRVYDTPVNVKVGRFMPALSLWSRYNRVSISENATTSYLVGESTFRTSSSSDGIELNSILLPRLFMAGGIVKRPDQDDFNGYGSIRYKFGGSDFLGVEAEPNPHFEFLDYFSMYLAGYAYAGQNRIGLIRQTNDFYRYGFDGEFNYQRLQVKLATAFGSDDNAISDYTGTNPRDLDSMVLSAEAWYLFGSEVITSFRYEYVDNGSVIDRRYIPSVTYAPLQNVKITAEYKITDRNNETDSIFNLALVGSF